MATNYSTATIAADRGQRSFGLSLEQFIAKRGAPTIVARGRGAQTVERRHVRLHPATLRRAAGTAAGNLGNGDGLRSTCTERSTLCRRSPPSPTIAARSAYFTDQLYAALTLIDRGALSPQARGSMHGEIGQTQFLPKNILEYGVGGSLDVAANALASTANFLNAHGWRAGAGYQPGEPNFAAIQAWNAAPVYQRALAMMGAADRPITTHPGSAAVSAVVQPRTGTRKSSAEAPWPRVALIRLLNRWIRRFLVLAIGAFSVWLIVFVIFRTAEHQFPGSWRFRSPMWSRPMRCCRAPCA